MCNRSGEEQTLSIQFWFMNTDKGKGYSGIWYWFLQEQKYWHHVFFRSSYSTGTWRSILRFLWKSYVMFLRFTVVWLPFPKFFELYWRYNRFGELLHKGSVTQETSSSVCQVVVLIWILLQLTAPETSIKNMPSQKESVSWSYRLFFFFLFLLFNQSSQQLCCLTRCHVHVCGRAISFLH